MRKLYNFLVFFLERKITNLHILKMFFGEHYALLRKKHLYKNIKWTSKQKKNFDEFWKKHYGKKISTKGHKLYESLNGVYHKDYFPDWLFATKLEPKLNNFIYARIYSDKSLTELIYSKNKDFKMPKTCLVKSKGIWYNESRKVITSQEAELILNNLGKCVIKPTIGGSSGKGILFCNFQNGIDQNNNIKFEFLDDPKNKNFIIQEKMIQHESFSKLYTKSINTIRIITYILNGEIFHAPICLRIGTGNIKVDNIHSGGLVIGVNDNGTLLKQAFKLGYSDNTEKYTKHPDTKIEFENYQLESIDKIIKVSKEIHGMTPQINMISWDFTVDKTKQPILIEANYMGQSI